MLSFPVVSLISGWLGDEIFATMGLNIVPITRLLPPSTLIERLCIALLVAARVMLRVKELVEV